MKDRQQQSAPFVNSLGDAAVVGAEVWCPDLRAPSPSARATLRDTARGAVAGLNAVDAVAAHHACRGSVSVRVVR